MQDQGAPQAGITRRIITGLVFGFLTLLTLVLLGDIRQVGSQVAGFRWQLYPAVLGLTLFNYLLRFLKWHFYLGQIGVRNLGLLESARLFVAGFPLAVTPGKAGEVLKAVWLRQAAGAPIPSGISVVLAERISDGLAVLFLSTLGVIGYPQYWPEFFAILAILLTFVIVSQIRPLALALLNWGLRVPVVKRFIPSLQEFYESSFQLFRPRSLITGVGLGAVSWLGEGTGMYLILLGLGVEPGWKAYGIAVFALSFSIVIGAASTLPGGLGASELSISGMLALLLGVSADLSAAATLLIRFATLWFGVSLGLLVWAFSRDLFKSATRPHLP